MFSRERLLNAARVLALIALGLLALRIAWISDDALITLRTALNITHGWGPGFNATEAVQAYTHPLWFLLWTVIGYGSGQWILGVIALSLACTIGAVALILWRATSLARIIGVTGLLALSNAFMDFTTSGLENPLAYLSIGILFSLLLRQQFTTATSLLLGLTLAAIVLTRLDLILLITPPILMFLWLMRRHTRLLMLVAGSALAPLAAWLLWSYFTYATWLPNTFAAKRNLDIPATELSAQGLMYLWVSFTHDPVSLIAIASGVVLSLFSKTPLLKLWSVGILLYLAYTVMIGGDFMGGRFLAVPVYVAVALLAIVPLRQHVPRSASDQRSDRELNGATFTTLALVTILLGSWTAGGIPGSLQSLTGERYYDFNVGDERGFYTGKGRDFATLLRKTLNKYESAPKEGDLYSLNVAAATWPSRDPNSTPQVTFAPMPLWCVFAQEAIEAGPTVHYFDPCGLTDRFIAETRYAPEEPFRWRMGHFVRRIPAGYEESVRANNVELMIESEDRQRLSDLWSQIR